MSKEKLCVEAFKQGHPNWTGPILWGTHNNNLFKAEEYETKGIPYVYIDMPYFDKTRSHFESNQEKWQFRVCFNSILRSSVYNVPSDRFARLHIKLKPWRTEGEKILVLPSSKVVNSYYGKGGNWQANVVKQIKVVTNRTIRMREKKSVKHIMNHEKRIQQDVHGCWTTVSLVSLAGIQSIIAGVPSFCHFKSACAPMGNTNLKYIETPQMLDRAAWVHSLAYGQFTFTEMSQGLPGHFRSVYVQPR